MAKLPVLFIPEDDARRQLGPEIPRTPGRDIRLAIFCSADG